MKLSAGDVVRLAGKHGLTVTHSQVRVWVPGGVRESRNKPLFWEREAVLAWLGLVGAPSPRKHKLVTLHTLAQRHGLTYWQAKRRFAPTVVLSHHHKFYAV